MNGIAHPALIQGGMGIGVSHWVLAKAVSQMGQLGVISGTAADSLFIRRLQDGDEGGHVRRAMARFPRQDIVEKILGRYFRPEGRKPDEGYKLIPMYQRVASESREFITMLGTFIEVTLAKEGHSGVVGMNLLTKIQLPNLASILGALLAKVDYILMGAGIPKEIPEVIERLVNHETASLKLDTAGPKGDAETFTLDPKQYFPEYPFELKRPYFLPIVSSHSLAVMLAKKDPNRIDGFVVENWIAGGHNAPARDGGVSENGEPIYGERDEVDLAKMRDIGKPFWLAGGQGASLREAQAEGAQGIQVGTLFAFSRESGMTENVRRQVLGKVMEGSAMTITDAIASPTGFPFKVFQLDGTLSTKVDYEARRRRCDLGYLRTFYRNEDGKTGFRCAAEPVEDYVKKGGKIEETVGRKCLCNSLLAAVGRGQHQEYGDEMPLITSGGRFEEVRELTQKVGWDYSARDAVRYILGEPILAKDKDDVAQPLNLQAQCG